MLSLLLLTLALQTPAAQTTPAPEPKRLELAPGTRYDVRIPTLRQVVGHDLGARISSPDDITTYLKALAAAAPDRMHLVEYARTWEGRPLHVAVIGSADRIGKLDQIKADLKRLADPRGLSDADADRLVRELPVVTWLLHAVHGNEISSSDAALAEVYHLLAAQGDPTVDAVLRDSLVLIDPLQNPDGRARFVVGNLLGQASEPDPEPASAEHDEPWPGGRSNHYLFDMNRDYLALSQPETRGRVRIYLDWYPQVVVDLHEMGGNSTYYFAPPAEPANPHITKEQFAWFDVIGRANAKRFDERGFAYFTREVYDSFYPGYGESWPIFQGAVGMTYEQASARGLAFRREDETLLTYNDGVVHHFTAAITTAHTAAINRERMLRDFLAYRRAAVAGGERGTREYVIAPGDDPARARRLAQLLALHGIEVRRAEEEVRVGARALPAGSFLVSAAQPSGRFIRNVLDPQTSMSAEFITEQERRRSRNMPEQIYDVTAWSLPLLFDLEVVASDRALPVRTTPVAPLGVEPPARQVAPAKVAYLLPWGSGTAAAVAEALRSGIDVRVAGASFTLAGRRFPRGTAIVRIAGNPADLPARLTALATRHGIEVVPTDTGYVEDGISLGSGQVAILKAPRVLLAWDSPAQSLSAGWARYVLERRFGHRPTAVRVSSLGRVDMSRYDVLVLPSGNYTALNEDAVRRLKDWIRGGGTLVTLGEASRWATRDRVTLLETKTELRDGRPDVEGGDKESPKPQDPKTFDLQKAIQPERARPDPVPGAIFRVALDEEHWLTSGLDAQAQAIVESDRVFTPIKLDKGRNIGVYAARDELVASGFVWPETREAFAQKAYLMHAPLGGGHVIAFAEDPNYRAYAEATALLFMNAVLLGPGF
jgi:hypothetical protein